MINQIQNMIDSHEKAPPIWNNPLSGEKPLWFHRFLLYRDLGPKRSLKAALAKEQEQFSLVETSSTASNSTEKPAHVPGSWKQASVAFQWRERAKAFDLAVIGTMAQGKLQEMGASLANPFARIEQLQRMATSIDKFYSDAVKHRTLTHQEGLAYARLLRDIIKDIRDETAHIDEETLLQAINGFILAKFLKQDWSPENAPNFAAQVVAAIQKTKREAKYE